MKWFSKFDACLMLLAFVTCLAVDNLDGHHWARACVMGVAIGIAYGIGSFDTLATVKAKVAEHFSSIH